jgi:hypothetical protein
MALPKLNELPMYSVTIPSTGNKTRFRPYLVKEEKVLLIALESQDSKAMAEATIDLIVGCLEDDINKKTLTSYDIEYLFLKIRAKSVGENASVGLLCSECEVQNDVDINLDTIEVQHDLNESVIQLTETISVQMRHIPYVDSMSNDKLLDPSSYAEFVFESVMCSFEAVLTDDERVDIADETPEDAIEFVESLTTEQFNKMRAFVENAPTVSKLVEFTCSECSHENTFSLKGLSDFFD